MPHSLPISDFLNAQGIILDVRSPSEYAQGHIPMAESFPLFTDEQRAQVGTCYKQQGRDQAVELGFAIAGPKFVNFITQAKALAPDKQVRIHCWRGGMRSGAVAWVLEMAGFQVSTLKGGYKTFRNWALNACQMPKPIITLGGMTGTGKTNILTALTAQGAQTLDLEQLASHRGSSFGSLGLPPQPSNEHFENRVAIAWSNFDPAQPIWIEAESCRIGMCRVPDPLFQQMLQAPIIQVVRPRAERLGLLVEVYGSADTEELISATERIRKRLGGLRTQQAIALLQQRQLTEAFDLILEYYDKTYQYDLEKRKVPIYSVDVTGLSDAESAALLLEKARFYCQELY
ncbi:tRNA 2-selenouridine(34) synthase MnmH [Cyanobacteria bacterium FACHB-471]|nr:tRNA 2-selenouridine(34) synthase MnmH [Cyanobacteria bacterium FACHB-471]